MVTIAENERLTRITGAAPLGRLLRDNHWLPFARSQSLSPGGAPQRVRLLGQDLVAFRGQDGTLGLVDEACPHRRASLALARVEGCTLRCLYHGWAIAASGEVIEVPSEGARSPEFAHRIRTHRYRIRDAGGLLWAFLGAGDAPELPPLPFMAVGDAGRAWFRMKVPCNWLQGFEGALDSVHLNWLHQGWSEKPAHHNKTGQVLASSPRYEIEPTAYGLRTAAIRQPAPDRLHFRVAEFVAPFFAFSASRQPTIPSDCSCFISVPMDDENHILLFGFWDETGELRDVSAYFGDLDPDALVGENLGPANAWGQDREAMAQGHFSGFTASVLHEDVAVQASMGAIVDRSEEQLCPTDLAIVRMRRFLLEMIDRAERGEAVDRELAGYAREGHLPFSHEAAAGADWRQSGQRRRAVEPAA